MLRQCFKCQRYEHTSRRCRSEERCGQCAGNHDTRSCQTNETKCAGCNGNHPSWTKTCPKREKNRARGSTRSSGSRLFRVPASEASEQTSSSLGLNITTPSSMASRLPTATPAIFNFANPSTNEEWTLVEGTRKRKIARPRGRPPGSKNKFPRKSKASHAPVTDTATEVISLIETATTNSPTTSSIQNE